MLQAYRKWREFMTKCLKGLKYYCVLIMLAMLALCFVQVVRRYFFNAPWIWSDEIILLLLTWFAYPALCFNIWTDDHFHIASVYDKFPEWLQIICDLIRHVLIGVFFLVLGYYGTILIQQNWVKPYAASGLPQGIRFIPVIFGSFMSTVFCISNIIGTFIDRKKPISPEEMERLEKEFAEQSLQEAQRLKAELDAETTKKEGKNA